LAIWSALLATDVGLHTVAAISTHRMLIQAARYV
jgi:hypothetical protein